jgi:hypothetical protein
MLDRIATRHNVYPSTLVDLALMHTLSLLDAGDLVIDQAPIAYTVTGLRKRVQGEQKPNKG